MMNLANEFDVNDLPGPTLLGILNIEAQSESIPLGLTAFIPESEEGISEKRNPKKGNPKKRKVVPKEARSQQNKDYQRNLKLKEAARKNLIDVARVQEELKRAQEIVVVEYEHARRGDIVKVYFSNQLLFELEKLNEKYSLKNQSDSVFRMDLANPSSSIVKLVESKKIVKILICDRSYGMSNTESFVRRNGEQPVDQLTSIASVQNEVEMGQWFAANRYGPMYVGYSHWGLCIHFIYMEDISYSFEAIGEWPDWFRTDKKRRGPMLLTRIFSMMGMMRDIHGRGVIHGDMHSLNVFFSKDMYASSNVKLIDFGRSVDLNVCVSKYGWLPCHVVLAKYLDTLSFLRLLWKSMNSRIQVIYKSFLEGANVTISQHDEDNERVRFELAVDVTGIIFDYCNSVLNEFDDSAPEAADDDDGRSAAESIIKSHIRRLKYSMQIAPEEDVTLNKLLSSEGYRPYLDNRSKMFGRFVSKWKKYGGNSKDDKCLDNIFPVPKEGGGTKLVGWLQLVCRKTWF
jgi:hypothetical protein